MLLGEWLEKNKISRKAFAEAIDSSSSFVGDIANMTCGAGREMSLKIEEATEGEVTRTEAMYPSDFIDKDKNGNIQKRSFPKPHKLLAPDFKQKLIAAKGTARRPKRIGHNKAEMKEFIEIANAIKELRLELAMMKREVQGTQTTNR